MREWYAQALGIDFNVGDGATFAPREAGADTVFSLFDAMSEYIGDPTRQGAMVNFLVDDLDGVVERLRDRGEHAEPIQDEGYGRFSWTVDPEGHRIELWQPAQDPSE